MKHTRKAENGLSGFPPEFPVAVSETAPVRGRREQDILQTTEDIGIILYH